MKNNNDIPQSRSTTKIRTNNSGYDAMLVSAVLMSAGMVSSASADVSVNIGYVTDYIYQGISNSNREGALQGGIDFSHEAGGYVGTWFSKVDFQDNDEAKFEWDVYAGYGWTSQSIDWNVEILRFMYPGADSSLGYDSNQASVSAGLEMDSLYPQLAYTYSPDYFSSGETHYLELNVDYYLTEDYTMAFHIARFSIEDNASYGTPNYTDWMIGISREWNSFNVQLSVQGTDMNSAECFGGTDWCDSQVALGVTYTY